jgi:hypothetical protein
MSTRSFAIEVCLAALLLFGEGASYAQQPNYQRVIVAKRVSLDIPVHWQALDIDQRRNLAAAAERWSDGNGAPQEPAHVAALAISAKPDPPGAIIRVSVIATEGPTQSDLRLALQNDRVATMKELTSALKEELSAMEVQMQKQGMSILDQEKVAIENIGGKIAVSVTYRRTPAIGDSPFQVTQYFVPLGNEKVLITLSFRESSAFVYSQILEYVKKSISVK